MQRNSDHPPIETDIACDTRGVAGSSHPLVTTFAVGDAAEDPDVDVLGAKGAGLVDMAAAGLPVPPGFVLPTSLCRRFVERGWTADHTEALRAGVAWLEAATGRRLGDPDAPLLVSVRSGAPVSMPGMLDSILDVGMTDTVAAGLARHSDDSGFAADTHRRFLDGFRSVVGDDAPAEPMRQVERAVAAVFASAGGARARAFQHRSGRADDPHPTAVVVQQMVFGNLDDASGTGVAHSRDPIGGAEVVTGEYLARAQGLDVVSGTHRTDSLDAMARHVPDAHAALVDAVTELARRRAAPVEVEFTVEAGRLYLLQVRRSLSSIDSSPESGPAHDAAATPSSTAPAVAGVAGSAGTATGVLVTRLDDALARSDAGQSVVLVRPETTPADVEALSVSSGLVTVLGGMTSHAAVVARAWGIPAVVGCRDIEWRDDGIVVAGRHVPVGAAITVDGTAGVVHVPHENG